MTKSDAVPRSRHKTRGPSTSTRRKTAVTDYGTFGLFKTKMLCEFESGETNQRITFCSVSTYEFLFDSLVVM